MQSDWMRLKEQRKRAQKIASSKETKKHCWAYVVANNDTPGRQIRRQRTHTLTQTHADKHTPTTLITHGEKKEKTCMMASGPCMSGHHSSMALLISTVIGVEVT